MTPCPVCHRSHRDLASLSRHVETVHPFHFDRLTAVVIDRPLPVYECDLDRIHSSAIAAEKAEAVRDPRP